MNQPPSACPLCEGPAQHFGIFHRRAYGECPGCGLVFMLPAFLPSLKEEKSRYLLHNNSPADEGYRRYLRRLTEPLKNLLKPPAEGLDFGCGPNPATGVLLERAGISLRYYDPFFRNDTCLFEQTFDFLVCTEVVEHFHQPRQGFEQLRRLLKPGGYCAVLTRLFTEGEDFGSWFYPRDFTHTSFYRPETMQRVAEKYFCGTVYREGDVFIFQG